MERLKMNSPRVKVLNLWTMTTFSFVLLGCSVAALGPEYVVDSGMSSSRMRPHIMTLERQRRDVALPISTTLPTTATQPVAVESAGSAAAAALSNDANRTKNSTVTSTDPAVTQIPLLGANGTGILKVNITKNPKVSEPIIPDGETLNVTQVLDDTPEMIKAEHNMTALTYDHHVFYNSTFIGNDTYFMEHWKNITSPAPNVHSILSNSHRRATNVALSFAFPFYGHSIKSVTVATGGFIYTGEQVHSWLAATQYIAPLMANFDTRQTDDSRVSLNDDGEKFSVLWENVTLQDNSTLKFTFAVTLYKNGNIDFAYKDMPIPVQNISETVHPVKVGISDAYITDKIVFYVRRKTIYEYHRASFKNYVITSNTILRLTALPTCMQYDTCESCLNHDTGFNCTWCVQVQKCSSGTDKNKQDWTMRKCDLMAVTNETRCPYRLSPDHSEDTAYQTDGRGAMEIMHALDSPNMMPPILPSSEIPVKIPQQNNAPKPEPPHSAIGGVVAAFIAVAMVVTAAGWVVYAFRNPHTPSGQLLIKYRPTQWNWRRGEARYTAATIHM